MADLEHQGLGDLSPEPDPLASSQIDAFGHTAEERALLSTSKPRRYACDCCDSGRPVVWRGVAYGIETGACWVCANLDEHCDHCLEPLDACACDDDKSEHAYERDACVNPQTGAVELL
jgi:hypothetical protein